MTPIILLPQQVELPDSIPAQLVRRNGHPVLAFDDTTDEEAVFTSILPDDYGGGGLTVTLIWAAEDTTVTPHNAVWQVAIERIADDAQDMDSDSFAAFNGSGAVQEASASGEVSYDDVTFTDGADMDSLAAGELFRLKVRRDADNTSATDSLTGDAQLRGILITET